MQLILRTLFVFLFVAAPATDPSPALSGIAHVAFRVSDVAKSRDFYRSLGFEQSFEFADPGKPLVSYIKINDRQFIELYGRADDSQPTGLMHVCYEAANIESLWNEYAKRDVNASPPKKARAGNMLFLFRDPENQIVEYTQYLPGSLHFEDRGKHLGEHRISQQLKRAVMLVRDLPAEQNFFASKLAFEEIPGSSHRFALPGNSGEELEFQPAAPDAKPRIVFFIRNLAATVAELRKRSFNVSVFGDSASITDPDGLVLAFEPEKSAQKVSANPKE